MQYFEGKILEKKKLAAHVLEVAVQLVAPEHMDFRAGQFVEFRFGNQTRAYSITTVPSAHATVLKFCIELIPQGVGSSFFEQATPGTAVHIQGPFGIMTVNDFSQKYFFVAAGMGITPFVSSITDALARGCLEAMHLIFGVQTEEDIFYFDHFRHLERLHQNFTFEPIVSRPKSHWPGEIGRVTTHVDLIYQKYGDFIFYICGSSQMVSDVRTVLLKKGHSAANIQVEVFD